MPLVKARDVLNRGLADSADPTAGVALLIVSPSARFAQLHTEFHRLMDYPDTRAHLVTEMANGGFYLRCRWSRFQAASHCDARAIPMASQSDRQEDVEQPPPSRYRLTANSAKAVVTSVLNGADGMATVGMETKVMRHFVAFAASFFPDRAVAAFFLVVARLCLFPEPLTGTD